MASSLPRVEQACAALWLSLKALAHNPSFRNRFFRIFGHDARSAAAKKLNAPSLGQHFNGPGQGIFVNDFQGVVNGLDDGLADFFHDGLGRIAAFNLHIKAFQRSHQG
ncbi:MAG: hypothetical protein ACOX5D_11565 [Limnochordia bacterium]